MTADAPAVRTVIVDDEPLARRRLRAILAGMPEVEIVGEAGNGTTAVAAIVEKRPDLLLLDIQMPGKDGFAVLREIAGVHQPVVVFVTAHDEHAIRAFDVQAIDYVLKPVVEDRLREAVRRAITRLREHRRGDVADAMARLLAAIDVAPDFSRAAAARIAVKTDRGLTLVPVTEIHWIEADRDLVKLHTARGTHVVRSTLSDIETRLGTGQFARVHRSVIVNISCIQEIQPMFKGDYVLVLKSGVKLRTGRAHRAEVQALIRGTAS